MNKIIQMPRERFREDGETRGIFVPLEKPRERTRELSACLLASNLRTPPSHSGVLFPFGSGTAWDRFLRCFWGIGARRAICYHSRACGVYVKNIDCRRSVMHACHEKLFRQRHEGAFRPLGEEQRRSGKSHPGDKGFRELFPRAHHSRRVLGLGLPGQGWCRREHSGSTGVDHQECQQNWCGPTNYLGRHSHAAIEVNLSLSETYALKYWWCSPPRTLRAISNHCDEDALTLLSPSLP